MVTNDCGLHEREQTQWLIQSLQYCRWVFWFWTGGFTGGGLPLRFTASILNLLCSPILSDVLLLLLCSPTFSYVFLCPTPLLHCLVLHLTFHLHIPHHLFFSHVPSIFPSYEGAILCSLSLTAGFHLLSDVLSSLMLSHDSISNPTGSSLLSCHLPSPLSPTLSSPPSVASTPLPSLPLRFLSVSLLLVALIVSCCRCSLSSLFVFHLPFPSAQHVTLLLEDKRLKTGRWWCVRVHLHINPLHSSPFTRDNWKEVFPRTGQPPVFKCRRSKQSEKEETKRALSGL